MATELNKSTEAPFCGLDSSTDSPFDKRISRVIRDILGLT